MKCTIENINLVADKVIESHLDSQTGYSIPEFDDKSDLLTAFKIAIEWITEAKDGCWNGIRMNDRMNFYKGE